MSTSQAPPPPKPLITIPQVRARIAHLKKDADKAHSTAMSAVEMNAAGMKLQLFMMALQIVESLPPASDVGRVNEILQNLINASICISQAIEYPTLGSATLPLTAEEIRRDQASHSEEEELVDASTSSKKRKE